MSISETGNNLQSEGELQNIHDQSRLDAIDYELQDESEKTARMKLERVLDPRLTSIAYRFMSLSELTTLLGGDQTTWISYGYKNRKEVNELRRSSDVDQATSVFIQFLQPHTTSDSVPSHERWSQTANWSTDFGELAHNLAEAEWLQSLGFPVSRSGLRAFREKILAILDLERNQEGGDVKFKYLYRCNPKNPDSYRHLRRIMHILAGNMSYRDESYLKDMGYSEEQIAIVKHFFTDPFWIENPGNLRKLYNAVVHQIQTAKINAQYRLLTIFDTSAVNPPQNRFDIWPSLKSLQSAQQNLLAVVSLMPDRPFRQQIETLSKNSGYLAFPVFDAVGKLRFPLQTTISPQMLTELSKIVHQN